MGGRVLFALGCLCATLAGLAWSRAESQQPIERLSPNEGTGCFAIDCTPGTACFDLEFAANENYQLIVSSLGHFGTVHRVTLEAQPVDERQRVGSLFQSDRGVYSKSDSIRTEKYSRSPRAPFVVPPSGGCTDSESVPPEGGTTNETRQFYLHVTDGDLEDARAYALVNSRLIAEGTNVRVYLDEQCQPTELVPGLPAEIIRLLDEAIIPRSRELIGTHRDVDGDGKLAVFLTPWLGKLRGGASTANGFVRGNDFEAAIAAPFSNHADVLYLNSTVGTGGALKALLAHEYTHAVCFSVRLANGARSVRLPDEDDWLNEAIAHVAENLYGADYSNLSDRIDCFLREPQKYPLVVRDYYRAGLWRDPGCRGATYLFLRWCVDQHGETLLRELATNPVAGTRNLEWATGFPFAELHRRWTIALCRGDISALRHLDSKSLNATAPCRPKGMTWNIEQSPCVVDVRGSATAFVQLAPPASSGRWRISVRSDAGVQMQLTLTREPVEVESRSLAPAVQTAQEKTTGNSRGQN